MRMMWIFYTVMLFAVTSTAYSIIVNPGENITEGNCSGQLDYFLCNCLSSNTDIHVSRGHYNVTKQPAVCLLENKTSISITGSTIGDTIIECVEPFSIVFMSVHNVTISNIKMINCGDVVDSGINETITKLVYFNYFGNGTKFVLLFYNATDVTINELTMLNTLGYGIVAFNMMGQVSLSKLHIENTTFENDPKCNGYDYNSGTADFACSGSGIYIFYHDSINLDVVNTTLLIDQSNFTNNKNFLPSTEFNFIYNYFQTAFNEGPGAIQGAASIAIVYAQNSFNVNTIISNSFFHSNNGTLSATIAVASFSTIRGKTNITDCLFNDNGRASNTSSFYAYNLIYPRGGISYQYLTLRRVSGLSTSNYTELTRAELFNVIRCNFTKNGGNVGAAIYIQKISTDSVLVFVRIENCYFTENEGSAGSAVYSTSQEFRSSVFNYMTITLVNVHATNNILSPGNTIHYVSSDLITGVFSTTISYMIFDCSEHCTFANNQPSLFYGYSTSLTISGKVTFLNNSGIYGGALDLVNTAVYVYQGSDLYFGNNYVTRVGGAINVFYTTTNLQTPINCPIQFTGPNSAAQISSFDKISQLNINITFENNTSGALKSLDSIYANVYYVCFWYPETLTQFKLQLDSPPINGTRDSVYGKVFKFVPQNTTNCHVYTSAYLPCICDENNTYNVEYCMTADINNTLKLQKTIIVGRSFTLNIITLDAIGAVGFTRTLYTEVFSSGFTDENFQLPENQNRRSFNNVNKQCTPVEFTIFAKQSVIPKYGILRLTVLPGSDHFFHFNVTDCPIGFSLLEENGLFVCVCGEFFMQPNINEDFQCNSASGMIIREDKRSWLSVVDDNVEYVALCLPVYCNDVITNYTLTNYDILCDNNHAGRACGKCIEDYGRVFGSNSCKRCSNAWLVTILLYAILGISLVTLLYLLRLTVTMGTINGLIFFCNVMSINERLFFNTEDSQFLFLRVFISLINLDLGFEMCFYNEMSQIAKTGLQFVFPVYLWLLVATIIIFGRTHFRSQRLSSYSTVPVLATLILLSYAKLLRTIISVFSFITIHRASKEYDFSISQPLTAWQPDPNVEYLQDAHIVLFLIAVVFMLLFIIPFALAMTFPTIILRSKRMSRLFPLLDCFYAPYKDKYRYWFGLRLVLLIYLSGMESIIFSYQEAQLLSGITVLFVFVVVQAYIQPFKNMIINLLDLLFMGIFILLSMITLYLYPSTSGYDEVNSAVNISYAAFFLFCLVACYHIHTALKQFAWYGRATKTLMTKSKMEDWKIKQHLSLSTTASSIDYKSGPYDNYSYLRESFLENL